MNHAVALFGLALVLADPAALALALGWGEAWAEERLAPEIGRAHV